MPKGGRLSLKFHSCSRGFASQSNIHFSDNISPLGISLRYATRVKEFIYQITFKYRINSARVEIKMESAGQTEIFRNKRTPFGGIPRFLLQSVQTEITVPFAQHFHFHLICYLFAQSSAITCVSLPSRF